MRQPKNPFHPGEILLEEFLKPGGISQTAFAETLGWTRARLNELIALCAELLLGNSRLVVRGDLCFLPRCAQAKRTQRQSW